MQSERGTELHLFLLHSPFFYPAPLGSKTSLIRRSIRNFGFYIDSHCQSPLAPNMRFIQCVFLQFYQDIEGKKKGGGVKSQTKKGIIDLYQASINNT